MENNSTGRRTTLIILLCWLGYTAATFGRINLSANIVNFTNVMGIPKSEFAAAGTAFAIVYGIGQLVNGVLCERLNSRIVLTVALILSGAVSIALGFISNIVVICVIWGVNGGIQSMLWCHVIKLISSFGEAKSVSKGLMIITTTTPVGTFLAYGLSALLAFLGVWQSVFVVSGVMLVAVGVVMLLLLPKMVVETRQTGPKTHKNSSLKYFLPCLIPVLVCAVFINYVYHGATSWMPNMLSELYEMPEYFSILLTMLLPVVGMVCGITAVKVTERTNNALVSSLIFVGVAALGVILSMFVLKTSAVLLIVGFVVTSFGIHVNNSLFTAVFPSSMRRYLGSGMLAGVIDAFCYVGTALSSAVPAVIIENSGYMEFLISLIVVCVLFAIVCTVAILLLKRSVKRYEQEK